MDKEIIDKVMFDNFLKSVPTMVVDTKDRKTISAYGSIHVEDLKKAIDRFDKVPTYEELLKENKKQQEIINKIEEKIKENIKNAKYEITALTITDKVYYKYIDDMLNELLQMLEDKEV